VEFAGAFTRVKNKASRDHRLTKDPIGGDLTPPRNAGARANPDELKDDLEKYEYLQELAKGSPIRHHSPHSPE